MKIKISETTPVQLNWLVAKCEGATNLWHDTVATWWVDLDGEPMALSSGWTPRQSWHPSSNWSQGGPIIDRELIHTMCPETGEFWDARKAGLASALEKRYFRGPTMLIAAMRCYVASKLGDEVEVPDELL